jgi:alkylated DNA repair dioxygenase AlkB
MSEDELSPKISGLSYYDSYITVTQESEFIAAIDAEPWDTTWKRRRQHYGASYGRINDSTREIPSWAQVLVRRLYDDGISDRPFDQMLVNEYFPGQGISMHRDYEPFDRTVVSLSLLSDCVMDFRHVKASRREAILLERRSLLVLSDEARYEWQHGIAPRKTDRWQGMTIQRCRRLSVTFRLLKRSRSISGEKRRFTPVNTRPRARGNVPDVHQKP